MRVLLLLLCLSTSGLVSAQEWVIPWVSQRTGQWGSELVFNNHGAADAALILNAVRADGETLAAELTVPASAQSVRAADDLFPGLGEGGGYAVFVSGSIPEMTVGVRVASLTSTSGFSPSMGLGQSSEKSSTTLVYPIMPPDGFSAPVFVNLSDQAAFVAVTAYGAAGRIGSTVTFTIDAHRPAAKLLTGADLFPEISEPVYLVAVADQPLLGANFYFNSSGEPAMINAVANAPVSADLLGPLLLTLETAAQVSSGYDAAAGQSLFGGKRRMDCPVVTSELQPREETAFLTANLDWGTGCTSALGVYHAGVIDLTLARNGTVSDFGWLNGDFAFTNLVTRYKNVDLTIDGQTHLEASSSTQNFTLTGAWSLTGEAPIFDSATSIQSDVFISANKQGDQYRAYGSVSVLVDTTFSYDMTGSIDSSDPVIYDYAACVWPIDGKIRLKVTYSDATIRGFLDFDTGNCDTAILSVMGISEEVNLSQLFGVPQ